uniref:GDP-fucose protein O-fucosyltransferase 1 n=1 Tax=Oncorhynchus kisutch TaxID=8019 RepID=A0A8C7JUB5_ONCKI
QISLTFATELTCDDNGYILYGPCRFGNQADYFLGSLAFAKMLSCTMAVSRHHVHVPYSEFFQLEALTHYHCVVSLEDLMKQLAPTLWPKGSLLSQLSRGVQDQKSCPMKVSVVIDSQSASPLMSSMCRFPPSESPVLVPCPGALSWCPSSVPCDTGVYGSAAVCSVGGRNRNQIAAQLPRPYVDVQLRIGSGWMSWEYTQIHTLGPCGSVDDMTMCYNPLTMTMCYNTMTMCFPDLAEIRRALNTSIFHRCCDCIIVSVHAQVKVVSFKPDLAQMDLYIISQSDHFVGNYRDVHARLWSFFLNGLSWKI